MIYFYRYIFAQACLYSHLHFKIYIIEELLYLYKLRKRYLNKNKILILSILFFIIIICIIN